MKSNLSLPLLLLVIASLFSCTNYGDKLSKDNVEVYYKDGIKKEEAQKTLDLLYPSWNESGNQKSVQLARKTDTVFFRMVIDEEKAKAIGDEIYLQLANEISEAAFKGVPVNVDLTNNTFESIRILSFKKMDVENYGTKIKKGNIEVYSLGDISKEEAALLAAFLDNIDGDAPDVKSFQADKNKDGIYIVNMVSPRERSATLPESEFYVLAGLLADSVFNGATTLLQLTDESFKPYQSFKSGN